MISGNNRPQLNAGDMRDPERLLTVLNEILLDFAGRFEELEAAKGLVVLQVEFETGAVIAAGTAPFTADGAGVRCSCPFTPTGLVLLQVDQTMPSGAAISSLPQDVKWHFAAGPGAAAGALHIDFVTGLAINSRYVLRVGVTRA